MKKTEAKSTTYVLFPMTVPAMCFLEHGVYQSDPGRIRFSRPLTANLLSHTGASEASLGLRVSCHAVASMPRAPRSGHVDKPRQEKLFLLLQRPVSVCCRAEIVIAHAPSTLFPLQDTGARRREVYCPAAFRLCYHEARELA
jgi:hypothetical protein